MPGVVVAGAGEDAERGVELGELGGEIRQDVL